MNFLLIISIFATFNIISGLSCPPLENKRGVHLKCIDPQNISTNCDSSNPPGTIAKFKCEEYYINKEISNGEISCSQRGEWDQIFDYQDFICQVECGNTKRIDSSIVFGRYSTKYRAPWHASIYKKKDGHFEYICGGNLINLNDQGFLILTAAHCLVANEMSIELANPNEFRIILGGNSSLFSENTNQDTQIFRVDLIENHPEYTVDLNHDIGIIKLKGDIKLSDAVRPVCLKRNIVKTSHLGRIVGFGLTEEMIFSDDLLYTELPIGDRDTCKNQIPTTSKFEFSSYKFCAGHPTYNDSSEIDEKNSTGICFGDSGGGFVQFSSNTRTLSLLGIASATLRDERISCSGYGYFTDATKYIGWIRGIQTKLHNGDTWPKDEEFKDCDRETQCPDHLACIFLKCKSPCHPPNPCGRYASCAAKNHFATCTCPADFLGDPYTGCFPECTSHTDCPTNRTCIKNKCGSATIPLEMIIPTTSRNTPPSDPFPKIPFLFSSWLTSGSSSG